MTAGETIRAAVFESVKPTAPFLKLTTLPAPVPTRGEAVIKVLASRVHGYASEIFDGSRTYPSLLPLVPGSSAIGIVQSVGPDATVLAPGQLVYFDPTIRARDESVAPESFLQGLVAFGVGQKLQALWLNGTWAEQVLTPLENLTRIPETVAAKYDAATLTAIGNLAVPFGGLADNVKPGQTVVTIGTGAFAASAVPLALALGARRVIATARNAGVLKQLVANYGDRVVAVPSTGDEAVDAAAIKAAAGAGFEVDVVFDMLPPAASFSLVRAAASALRFNGTLVLMGGEQSNVELPYPLLMMKNLTVKGVFMYSREQTVRLLGLIEAGLVDLKHTKTTEFKLDQVEDAIQHAKNFTSAFSATVLVPAKN